MGVETHPTPIDSRERLKDWLKERADKIFPLNDIVNLVRGESLDFGPGVGYLDVMIYHHNFSHLELFDGNGKVMVHVFGPEDRVMGRPESGVWKERVGGNDVIVSRFSSDQFLSQIFIPKKPKFLPEVMKLAQKFHNSRAQKPWTKQTGAQVDKFCRKLKRITV